MLTGVRILGEKLPPVQGTNMRAPVFNQKGGGGKTATVVNLGAALARQKKPALLIDLDPKPSLRDSRRALGQG